MIFRYYLFHIPNTPPSPLQSSTERYYTTIYPSTKSFVTVDALDARIQFPIVSRWLPAGAESKNLAAWRSSDTP